jgi:muramoyltetrapeptide carboxypeptidase
MKPRAIAPGDKIGVVAPASAPADEARLTAGLKRLQDLGFQIELARSAFSPHGYLAGDDEERASAFNGMLNRTDLSAIFAARGGYGCLRLLDHIDFEAARAHPKILVGYSDITALHLAMFERAGWLGLSGPMIATDWPDIGMASEQLFWDLAAAGWSGELLGPDRQRLLGRRSGTAEGSLVGGNLATITALVGSRYMPAMEGAILFIEDVNEPPYRIDAYLAHLKLSGVLGKLGGLVVGQFTGWEPEEGKPSLTYEEVIDHYTQHVHGPVASGLVYGHIPVKNTMPVGVRALLDVIDTEATLEILETVTV